MPCHILKSGTKRVWFNIKLFATTNITFLFLSIFFLFFNTTFHFLSFFFPNITFLNSSISLSKVQQ